MKAHYSGRKPSLIYPHIHVFDSLLPVWEDMAGAKRKDGREVEGSSLLTRRAVKRSGGSNPSPSAKIACRKALCTGVALLMQQTGQERVMKMEFG